MQKPQGTIDYTNKDGKAIKLPYNNMMVAHTRKGKVVKETGKRAVTIILIKVVLMHLTTIF